MSGDARVPEGFRRVEPDDPYEAHNGLVYWCDPGDGRIEVGLLAGSRHANEYGYVHGGVMMMMADAAVCMSSRWHDPKEGSVTVSSTSNFVAAAKVGEFLQTRSAVVRRTRRLSFVACEVVAGDRVCMTATAVIKRLLPKD